MMINKNDLVVITAGEYSDYRIEFICKALQDINWEELRDEYLTIYPDQTGHYKFRENEFVNWLVLEKKVIEELSYKEWYLCSYSDSTEMNLEEHKG